MDRSGGYIKFILFKEKLIAFKKLNCILDVNNIRKLKW